MAAVSYNADLTAFGPNNNSSGTNIGGTYAGLPVNNVVTSSTSDATVTVKFFGDFTDGTSSEYTQIQTEGFTSPILLGSDPSGVGYTSITTRTFTIPQAQLQQIIADGQINLNYVIGPGVNDYSTPATGQEYVQVNISYDGSTLAATNTGPSITLTPTGARIITVTDPTGLANQDGLGTSQVDTILYAGTQPLTLPRTVENAVLSGQGGTAVVGNSLDNVFTINSGSWTIDGVSGNDTVTFTTGRAAHSVVQNANGSLTITGPEGTEQISHVGTINFSDARIALDTSANASEVARLYDAVLHRQADIGGANAAVAALNAGTTPLALVQGLLNSAEGQQNFAPTLSNHDFVTALYTTVLGRAPDAGGQAAFEGALNGGASRASILLSFADSPEHVAHIGLVGQGVVHDIPLA